MPPNKMIENDYVKYEIENEILISTFKCDKLDLKASEEIIKLRLSFTENTAYRTCADATNIKEFTKEGRDLMSGKDAYTNILAFALITNNPINNMIGNFYLKIRPHPVPAKIFNSKTAALKWLKQVKI